MKYLIIVGALVLFTCIGFGEAADCEGKNDTHCCIMDGCAFCIDTEPLGICLDTAVKNCTNSSCTLLIVTTPSNLGTTNGTDGSTTEEPVTTTNATAAPVDVSTTDDSLSTAESLITPTSGQDATSGSQSEAPVTPTSQSPPESSTAEAPTPAHCDPLRQHFDAPSFIGGIVLCGAVIAIAFFGCKFYKQRSETKYQQF